MWSFGRSPQFFGEPVVFWSAGGKVHSGEACLGNVILARRTSAAGGAEPVQRSYYVDLRCPYGGETTAFGGKGPVFGLSKWQVLLENAV